MAPLITVTIEALLASVGLKQYQVPAQVAIQAPSNVPVAYKPCNTPLRTLSPKSGTASLSAISWAANRIDIFGQSADDGTLSHKWYDGYQWNPKGNSLENLGAEAAAAPVAVTAATGKMDVFSRGFDGELAHKYWDSTVWKPNETDFESLGGLTDITHSQLAATSWGKGRLDIFAIGANDSGLLHKYFDGSQWNPPNSMENLGNNLSAGVTAVSWDVDRLDVFALDAQGDLVHIYYDGSKWSAWEDLKAPSALSAPTVSSWGPNRLDIFATSLDKGQLWHTAWDGSQYLPWENLGGTNLIGPVAVESWGVNRNDIVALGSDAQYYYKYWDGSQWNPTDATLYPKGGNFLSLPTLASWGSNRLDIFGVLNNSQLGHQTWYGSGWYPEWGFEELGGDLDAESTRTGRVHKEL